jgi:hypothetical protein
VHYNFTNKEAFQSAIEEGKFLEYAHVHTNIYGTRSVSQSDSLPVPHPAYLTHTKRLCWDRAGPDLHPLYVCHAQQITAWMLCGRFNAPERSVSW